jgi:uncharacterized protein YkwD
MQRVIFPFLLAFNITNCAPKSDSSEPNPGVAPVESNDPNVNSSGNEPVVQNPDITQVPPATDTTAANNADVQFNLSELNRYRAQNGAGPLGLDSALSTFATAGNKQYSTVPIPHAHYMLKRVFEKSFCNGSAENQAGYQVTNAQETIRKILADFMAEGPGGSHHDNMINKTYTRIGISLLFKRNKLYLTNDFSGPCN